MHCADEPTMPVKIKTSFLKEICLSAKGGLLKRKVLAYLKAT